MIPNACKGPLYASEVPPFAGAGQVQLTVQLRCRIQCRYGGCNLLIMRGRCRRCNKDCYQMCTRSSGLR